MREKFDKTDVIPFKDGLKFGTTYPEIIKEVVETIEYEVPPILENTSKELLEELKLTRPTFNLDVREFWESMASKEIFDYLQMELEKKGKKPSKTIIDMTVLQKRDLLFKLKTHIDEYLLRRTKINELGKKATDFVPTRWIPIINEFGIVTVLSYRMREALKMTYENHLMNHNTPINASWFLDNVLNSVAPKKIFQRAKDQHGIEVICKGMAVSRAIIHSTTLNYALILAGYDHHISSIKEFRGKIIRRGLDELNREFDEILDH